MRPGSLAAAFFSALCHRMADRHDRQPSGAAAGEAAPPGAAPQLGADRGGGAGRGDRRAVSGDFPADPGSVSAGERPSGDLRVGDGTAAGSVPGHVPHSGAAAPGSSGLGGGIYGEPGHHCGKPGPGGGVSHGDGGGQRGPGDSRGAGVFYCGDPVFVFFYRGAGPARCLGTGWWHWPER